MRQTVSLTAASPATTKYKENKIAMFINQDNKYTEHAEYFYNEFIELYCIIGTTIAMETVYELEQIFESPDLLTRVPMPDYITEDYDEASW